LRGAAVIYLERERDEVSPKVEAGGRGILEEVVVRTIILDARRRE